MVSRVAVISQWDIVLPSRAGGVDLEVRVFSPMDFDPAARNFRPEFVFIDTGGDEVSGFKWIVRVRDLFPRASLVAVLRDRDWSSLQDLFRAGVDDVIRRNSPALETAALLIRLRAAGRRRDRENRVMSRLAESEARLTEKTTILETLIDILSHDTKNIFINLQTLIGTLPDDPIRRMLVENIEELRGISGQAVNYLGEAKRIRALSEIGGSIKVTKDRVDLFSHPRIHVERDAEYLLLLESSALIKNAMTNLVENALKYSPEDAPVDVFFGREEGRLLFRVIDRGSGIPDSEKPRIFLRDYRVRSTADIEGTGKGLWISKTIVEKEGGELWVSDGADGGAVFTIRLPAFQVPSWDWARAQLQDWYGIEVELIDRKAQAAETMIRINQGDRISEESMDTAVFGVLLGDFREKRQKAAEDYFQSYLGELLQKNPEAPQVLIADDSVYVHYYLGRYLTELGYGIVGFAKNGGEAWELFRKFKPDLVTLDNTMPRLSGIGAARKILSEHPGAKILFVTGLGEAKSFRKELQDLPEGGTWGILTKPFSPEVLKSALAGLFPGG